MDEDMRKGGKKLVVCGDRILIVPEDGEGRTSVGLYLPPTAIDRQAVQGGRIIARGPGTPLAEPNALDEEPWRLMQKETKYVPLQAEVGDYALFFRKAAVEITFEDQRYLVVPQAAILVLVRKDETIDLDSF
jgi:chaperonin GroES